MASSTVGLFEADKKKLLLVRAQCFQFYQLAPLPLYLSLASNLVNIMHA
jgi:hypothetical protein